VLRKFSWGNLHSLQTVPKESGVDMELILRSFHRAHYSPQNMKLCVVAPASLEDLEASVRTCFGGWSESTHAENDAIAGLLANEEETEAPTAGGKKKSGAKAGANGGKKKQKTGAAGNAPSSVPVDTPSLMSMPSLADVLGEQQRRYQVPVPIADTALLTRIIPIKATHRLLMQWQLPAMQHEYRQKNEEYVCHLLGHEGQGSIVSHLKEQGLATFVEAGCNGSNFESNSLFTLLRVQVLLTAKGLSNWMYVAQIVVQYISMVRKIGPQEWIFRELQRIAQLEYDFLDESGEEELAERLCVEMSPLLARSRQLLLPSSFLMWDWDPKGIQKTTNELSPDNMHVLLMSASYGVPGTAGSSKKAGDKSSESGTSNDNDGEGDEAEDWSDESAEEDSEEEDGADGAGGGGKGKGKGKTVPEEEAAPLSPGEIQALYTGPPEWLHVVRPPAFAAAKVASSSSGIEKEPELANVTQMQTEPHFKTQYWREALPSGIREMWASAWSGHAAPAGAALHLPEPNPYIPDDLSMVREDSPLPPPPPAATAGKAPKQSKFHVDPDPVPSRLLEHAQNTGLRVWHMTDPRFNVPKVGLYLRLASPIASSSARNAALNDLVRLLLYDHLEKELYNASIAELTTSLSSNDLGLDIKLKGFSDKALALLRTVLQTLTNPEAFVTEASFQLQTEKLIRSYRNDGLKSSSTAAGARLVALKPSTYSSRHKNKYMPAPKRLDASAPAPAPAPANRPRAGSDLAVEEECITAACALKFVKAFLRSVSVEILAHGNLTRDAVRALCDEVFTCEGSLFTLDASAHVEQLIVKLPQGIPTVLYQAPRNPSEPSVCVELYYQVGPMNYSHGVQLDLLEQILYEPFFDNLRTKQQLGYSVACSARSTFGILGFIFSVVSSSYSVAEVQQAILAYVAGIPRYLKTLPKDEFVDHVESLCNEKVQPPASLLDAFSNNMYCVADRRYDFDVRAEEVALLAAVTRESLSAFAASTFSTEKRRLMSVQASLEAQPAMLGDLKPKAPQRVASSIDQVRGAEAEFWPNMA